MKHIWFVVLVWIYENTDPFQHLWWKKARKPKAHLQWKETHLENKITYLGRVVVENRVETEFFPIYQQAFILDRYYPEAGNVFAAAHNHSCQSYLHMCIHVHTHTSPQITCIYICIYICIWLQAVAYLCFFLANWGTLLSNLSFSVKLPGRTCDMTSTKWSIYTQTEHISASYALPQTEVTGKNRWNPSDHPTHSVNLGNIKLPPTLTSVTDELCYFILKTTRRKTRILRTCRTKGLHALSLYLSHL